MQQPQFELQHQLDQPLSLFIATVDPNRMCFHQAMKAQDKQRILNMMDSAI